MPKPAHVFTLHEFRAQPPGGFKICEEWWVAHPRLPHSHMWIEEAEPRITEMLSKAGRSDSSQDWLDWCAEHVRSGTLCWVQNRRGYFITLAVDEPDEAFAYRMRWT